MLKLNSYRPALAFLDGLPARSGTLNTSISTGLPQSLR